MGAEPNTDSYETFSYDTMRDGPSIMLRSGYVSIPDKYPHVDLERLSAEMSLVAMTAIDIYQEASVFATVIEDGEPRLLLVIRVSSPHHFASLRVNLGKLANEVEKGLNHNTLRTVLDFSKK